MNPFATAAETAAAVRNKIISARELVELTFQRIDTVNPALNAIVGDLRAPALSRAAEADKALTEGRVLGPLHGVPITIKESFAYRGTPNTWGLPDLAHAVSPRTAVAIERLESHGLPHLLELPRRPPVRLERHDLILAAVDDIRRNLPEAIERFVAGRSSYGNGAGEQIGVARRHEPRAAAAQAESGDENAAPVDGVLFHHILQKSHHRLLRGRIAPRSRRAIRRDDDRIEILQRGRHDAAHEREAVVGRSLASARVQREDERPRLTFGIARRHGDAVQDSPGFRRDKRALKHGRRGGLAEERKEC